MSDDKVTFLPGAVRPTKFGEPNQALISALEATLEHARSGRLQSLVATGFMSTGERFSLWAGHHEDVYQMLGAINWLEHEYVARQTGKVT